MSASAEKPMPAAADLEAYARPGNRRMRRDAGEAFKALIVANGVLVASVKKLKAGASTGYARRRIARIELRSQRWHRGTS
jgi:hypothetical protein